MVFSIPSNLLQISEVGFSTNKKRNIIAKNNNKRILEILYKIDSSESYKKEDD